MGFSGVRRVSRVAAIAAAFCVATTADALRDVRFRAPGASEDLTERLRNASLLLEAEDEVDDVQEVLAAARAEYKRLLSVLYAEGHFGGTISITVDGIEAAALSPLNPPERIDRIEVRVEPGPQYLFSQARVQPLARGTVLPEEFALGRPAEVPAIRDAAEAAIEGWRDVGYAVAEIAEQDIVARHAQDRVEARIGVDTGPRVSFGEFTVTGAERVRESAIRRIADFPVGQRFSPERLEVSAQRLRRTGAFRSVATVEAEELDAGDELDIAVRLVEEEPRRFGFGAEVSTVEGLRLTAFWLHRNLLGGAERLRLEGEVAGIGGATGGIDYVFGADFLRPATLNANTDFYITAEAARLNEPEYTSETITFAAGFTRRIGDRFVGEAGIGYRFSRDENDRGVTEYSLLTFPISALADRREDPLNPTGGWFAEAEITPFLALNEASDSGARLSFDGRIYRGFGEDERFVLAGRFQAGSIVGADLEGVPNDYRFWSGGGGTVRGHEYQALGVTLEDGVESGGASFLGLSAEARVGVTERIQAVGFVDYGSVGEDWLPGGSGDDHVGAGLGVRYLTPIGPIRLDVAAPISGESDEAFQLYVGIGQAF